jgi:replication factor A1
LGELEKIGEPEALTAKPADAKPASTTIAGNGFYGNKPAAPPQQQQQQQHQSLAQRSGPSSSTSHSNIYPIEALSPYANKWTIKARVTSKSEIKTWAKASSEGKLFSVNLLDESGEIKATGFQAQVDTLYELFQEGSVYYISSPCRVQLAKKQFSNLPNDYELTFEQGTLVEKCEDQDNIPQVRYNFTNIGALQEIDKDSTIDVIGVLKEVNDVNQITSKTTGQPYDKRDLILVDDSGYSVKLTIWGKTATKFDAMPESIVAFKGAKVSDFNGKSLSLLSSGSMSIDPDIAEAYKLKGWYDSQGRSETFASHTGSAGAAGGRNNQLKTVSQVKDENLGMNEKDDYFDVKATIVFIKQDPFFSYPACLSADCNKKVIENDGMWRCENCQISHPRPQYRYILTISVSDHTGSMYLNCFDDVGCLIMGMNGDQLMELKENDNDAANKAFEDANCKTYTFTCRAKMETYQDQQRYELTLLTPFTLYRTNKLFRVRYQVLRAAPIDFKQEARKLTELIKLYNID